MSEFIPPEDAIVEETTKKQIDFVPPVDAETEETVEVEKKSDPKTQSPTTDPKDGESSSEDSLSELSPDKLGKAKTKKPSVVTVANSDEINEGDYEVVEELDVYKLKQEDLNKVFNRSQEDPDNLSRTQQDINDSKGELVSLKKIDVPYSVEDEIDVVDLPGEDPREKGRTTRNKGYYYVATYKNNKKQDPDILKESFDKDRFKMSEREAYDKYKLTGEIDLSLIKDNSQPDIIQDTPIYIKNEDYDRIFTDEVQISKPDADAERLPEFEITTDSNVLQADPQEIENKIKNLEQKRQAKKKEYELEQDPEKKKQLLVELEDIQDEEILTKEKKQEVSDNKTKFDLLTSISKDKPSPTAWANRKSRLLEKDEQGNYKLKERTTFFGNKSKDAYRFEETMDPVNVSRDINKIYINHGLGSTHEGNTVYVFKNPVFTKDGKLNYESTARANGIEDPEAFLGKTGVYENSRLVKAGIGYELDLSKAEDIEGFTNFIDKNSTEYSPSSNFAPGVEVDPAIKNKQKQIKTELKNNINAAGEEVSSLKKIVKNSVKLQSDIHDENKNLLNEFEDVNSKINSIEEENKNLKESIDSSREKIENKREQVKKAILENPSLKDNLAKEYNKWEKNFVKEYEDTVDKYNKNTQKQNKLSNDYKSFYDSNQASLKSLEEQGKEIGLSQKELQKNINTLYRYHNIYSAASSSLRNLELQSSDRIQKMLDKYEGKGNVVKELYNTLATQFAGTRAGTYTAFMSLAEGINKMGYELGGISESKYKSYLNTFRSQKASLKSTTDAIAKQLTIQGNDPEFSKSFADSLVGGTLNSFAQMAGATLGAPITGLAGGYFFNSLTETTASVASMENEFVTKAMKEQSISRAEATKQFEEVFSPTKQKMYSLGKATSEGFFSYITGKILKGEFNPAAGISEKITNSVLRKLTGNVTAKDLQIYIQKECGDLVAKCITKFGRVTTAGLSELADETFQTGISYGLDETFNTLTDNKVNFQLPNYSSENFEKEMLHMAGVSFLSGNAGGTFQSLITTDNVLTDYERETTFAERLENDKFLENVANTARDASALTAAIEMKQEQIGVENDNGEVYTQEDFNSDKFQMQKKFDIYNKIDSELTGTSQFEIASLLEKKENLEKQKESLAKGTTGRIDKKIEAIDAEIKDISNNPQNEKVKELTQEEQIAFTEKQLRIVKLEKVKNLSKDQDLSKEETEELLNSAKVEVFNDDNADEIAEKYNLNSEDLLDPEGVYLKDEGIILMSETASKGVLEHEAGHNFLDIALNDPKNKDIVFGLADSLRKKMREVDPKAADIIDKQIEKYKKDDRYNSEAVAEEIMTYYIQLKKRGLFKEGTTVGSEVQAGFRRLYQGLGMEIEINEDNIMDVLDDYVRNTGRGKLTRAQKKLAQGKVKFDTELREKGKKIKEKDTTPVISIKPDTKTRQAAALPIKVDTKSMSTAFDQNITEDLTTNEDFKNSEAAIDAFENIENNSQFNNYINQLINRDSNLQGLDSNVKQEVNRKIKENLQLRALNNFKPIVDGNRRSLFSYMYGKADQRGLGGIAQKALLDVKKEYATRVDSDARSIDKPTSEGQVFDIADTSTDIIAEVDRGVAKQPRSTFRRNIVRGKEKGLTDQEVKSFKEITKPIVDKLPPVDDKKYRTKVDQVSGKELKSWVKSNVLKGQDYKTFVKENYNNIRDLDLKYLIELDKGLMKQGKPRMFTKPNKRLTTQEDIRKYRDSGRAFVENEAQGVMLYDILDPGADATVDFYTKQTPQNVSNRKGKLAEAIGKKMFKDVLPETIAKRGDTDQQRATSARKTQTRPDLLFAKKLNEKDISKLQSQSVLRSINDATKDLDIKDKVTVSEANRSTVQSKILKAIIDGKLGLTAFESMMPASGGAISKRRDNGNKYYKLSNGEEIIGKRVFKGEVDEDGKPVQAKDKNGKKRFDPPTIEQIEKKHGKGVTLVPQSGFLYYGVKDPAYIKAETAAIKNDSENNYQRIRVGKDPISKAWLDKKNRKGLTPREQGELNFKVFKQAMLEIEKAVQDGNMDIETAALMILQGYQATSGIIKGVAQFKYRSRNMNFAKKGKQKSGKVPFREEHNPPASVIGANLIWAIKNGKVEALMTYIKKNFYQTQLSLADDLLLDLAKLDATLPEGISILDNPIIRFAVAGINLNTILNIETGQSIVDEFGLGVSPSVESFPGVIALQNKLVEQVVRGEVELSEAKKRLAVYTKFPSNGQPSLAKTQNDANKTTNKQLAESKVLDVDEDLSMEELLGKAASIDEALKLANSLNRPVKKIRVFDFDDTLATSNNKVFAVRGDESIEMNAEKFATDAAQMIEDGWVMDFSDFDNVTEGGRGPLFKVAQTIKDARGNEDLFVLTARGPNAEASIYEFLKAEGLEFKRENIVGLGKSPGEAKANWILDKAAEGYNDFYFADDAYQNVKAVQDVLSVIDVKSKIQQARIKESKKLEEEFNMLIEESTGVKAFKEYSAAKAKTIGASKGNFKFFIPYSAEDFLGLIYPTLTKGAKGDAQMAWYKQNLIDPYTKAQENLSAARLNLMNDFKQLKKSLDVPKDLRKKNDSGFTNEQAVRVHLFTSMGYEVPGLSKRDLKELNDIVEGDAKLKTFSNQILTITKGDGYAAPDQNWLVGTITTDLINLINTEKRSKYLAEWQERADVIYSSENLNKLEAVYGTKYRESLENVLSRMKSGKNRMTGGSKLENRILDYINGSIGTIMFFNTRSAVLQTISSINFVNWSFNNPIQAGKAFANQKQYWSDFKELMNSEYLMDRRNGLKLNISESEIADAASTSKNKGKAALNWLLSKGFLPTQIADSFAIASGGATFYRNRIKDLVKQGKTEADAKKQALIEFRQIAEESQQSSDPSRISSQQASNAGRIILAFGNTPMQYARIQKRAIQDLINGRGDAKANISKVIYYGFAQNIIFNVLQQAVFSLGFGDDEDEMNEEQLKAKEINKNKKYFNVVNGMLDSLLRGLGIGGAAVSVGKNFLIDIYERSGRDRPEYVDSIWEVTRFSPPIYSKLSKLKQAAWQFDSKKRREKIFTKGFALDNPAYEAASKVVSATTNVPLDRVLYKFKNIEGALNEDNEIWQRIAMLGGWPEWQLKDPKVITPLTDEEKTKAKENKKQNLYKEAKGSTDYDTLKKLTSSQQIKMLKGLGFGEYTIKNAKSEDAKIKLIQAKNSGKEIKVDKQAIKKAKFKKLSKADQVRKLDSLGLSSEEIKALKYENDRVNKMLELMK